MKKCFSLILTVLFTGFLITSCDKKEEGAPEKFSTKSVEENKAVVEKSGVDMVSAMRRMENLQVIGVLSYLKGITMPASSVKSALAKNSKMISTVDAILSVSGKKDLNPVFRAMISAKELKEEPSSIQQAWSENVGTYNFIRADSSWSVTYGGDKLILKFPSTASSSTNDAILTLSNYKGVNIANPADEDYKGDLPASLNADLKVGTKTLFTYTFAASYNSDGIPSSVASDLSLENFKFEIDITNNNTVVSVNYKFLEGTNVILDFGVTGNGLFTEANYNSHTTTTTVTETYVSDYVWNSQTQQYDPVYSTNTYDKKKTDFEEILNSANAHFQIFNIALRGDVDVKNLADQIKAIDKDLEDDKITQDAAWNSRVSKINQYLNLRMVNVTSNEILAKAEAYVAHDTEDQESYLDFRLTFGDGSPVDMQTYFGDGFDSFISELNGLINDINTDYDADIDPIQN